MTDRSCLIEHVFGEIKGALQLRRFPHRGIEKVKVTWELVCIGYNFSKLARLAYGTGLGGNRSYIDIISFRKST